MTIGRNSRKTSTRSSIRAPKFLDKSSGFYGRLDEPESATDGGEMSGDKVEMEAKDTNSSSTVVRNTAADEDVEIFAEDDGETLLRRKPSRLSSRWRRSSRRKQKDERVEEAQAQDERPGLEVQEDKMRMETEKLRTMEKETTEEPDIAHFQVREFADDRVLIRDKKRGREDEEEEEGEEERKMKKEQEEGMKMVKRNTVKDYRKAFDRALRRGWGAFITNLYSVTLTPVKSSSPPTTSPSLKKKTQHAAVLAEFQ
ncbi:uncharacterized protein V3H82_013223 [Fundulus diaphanus]